LSAAGARCAEILAIGDELLAGAHPDLNSPELARELGRLGIKVQHVEIVRDDEEAIATAVKASLARAGLLIVTGGLGPTQDDVTRHGIARAFGRELETSAAALDGLKNWFERRGTDMPVANERQALLPAGAALVHNRRGTAPGFRVVDGERVVVSLPGPPPEMRVVFAEEVAPWLVATGRAQEPLAEHRFFLFGLPESLFEERAGEWMARTAEPRMGCSAKKGVLHVVLRIVDPDGPAAERGLAERVTAFRERFGPYVFSEEDGRLEHVLGRELLARELSVTLAESCTGGLAASLLTRVPGISAVFERAYVAYSDAVKQSDLGVPAEVLASEGAVSPGVARAMAAGAAQASGARLAIAVTGIAGPEGGTPDKPVGLVCFATCLDGEVRTFERRFPPGERDWIRTLAARTALWLGLQRVRGE